MWKNLLAVLLLAILCSHVGLCVRRSSARRKWWNKSAKNFTKSPTTQRNLCYGSEMIDGLTLEANDTIFYRDNAREFPNGVFYPNCSLPLWLNESRETRTEECVDFIVTSSNLSLPNRKNASDPGERVMWLVINHLCANESCSQPCPGSSNVNNVHYFIQILMASLWLTPFLAHSSIWGKVL